MNRRSFFARMLGAACLAVAERVLPSSIGAVKPQWAEPTAPWTVFGVDVAREGADQSVYYVVYIGTSSFRLTTDDEP